MTVELRLAQWFDEESVRHSLLADNSVFEIGEAPPTESLLALSALSTEGIPGDIVYVPLVLSMAEGVAMICGEVHYDPLAFLDPRLVFSPDLDNWAQTVTYEEGGVRFLLNGETDLHGLDSLEIGWIALRISPDGLPGTIVEVILSGLDVRSLGECQFLAEAEFREILYNEPYSSVGEWRLYDSGESAN